MMKTPMLFLGILGLTLWVRAISLAQETTGEVVLVGPLKVEDLLDLPGWFGPEFTQAQLSGVVIDFLNQEMPPDVDIICILGTWCDDSKRDVPRMLAVLQRIKGFDPHKMRMIGVDREKRSPGGEAEKFGVTRVPTFIIRRGGEEIGRIVEKPVLTLEADLLAIIRGQKLVAPPPPELQPPEEPHQPPVPPEDPAKPVEGEIRTDEPVRPDGSVPSPPR
ncbi:MAG: thioredoxin family protein [Bacteroidota bacterium]|nr:thioredoxin family protein [Bacteroidota bacterium]